MLETPKLALPLLASSQAQKHIRVNEALTRLDTLFMLSAKGRFTAAPPGGAVDGDRWIVPAGATGDWAGHDHEIAVASNGGWDYVDPLEGWRCWIEDESIETAYVSGAWIPLIYTPPAIGATVLVHSFEHAPTGAVSDSVGTVPAGSIVFGVSARVVEAITGATGWKLGVAEAPGRYGTGHGIGLNDVANLPTTAPMAYPLAIPLRLTAEGGTFTGGRVAFNIHYMTLSVPDPV